MRTRIFLKSDSLTTHKYFQNVITDLKHRTYKYFLFIQWPIYIYLVPTMYQIFLLRLGYLAGAFFPCIRSSYLVCVKCCIQGTTSVKCVHAWVNL